MYCLKCGGMLEQKNGDSKEGLKEEYYKCQVCGTSHTQKAGDSNKLHVLANKELYIEY